MTFRTKVKTKYHRCETLDIAFDEAKSSQSWTNFWVFSSGHALTLVGTAFSPSNAKSDQDYDVQILELALESQWDDGVDRIYEICGN